MRREYFEPGQVIFREGDRGDRLYVVTGGEVEVLRDGGSAEKSFFESLIATRNR